jgi:hypothetical protein
VRAGSTSAFRQPASLLPYAVDTLHKLSETTLWDLFVKKLLTGHIYLCRTKHIRFSGLARETAPVAVETLSNETMQIILAKLEQLDHLEQAIKRNVTIEPVPETPPALPVPDGSRQEEEQPVALFPAVPGVSQEDVKSVVDAYLAGIAKRNICSHLKWSNNKYGRVVKPVLDAFLTQYQT